MGRFESVQSHTSGPFTLPEWATTFLDDARDWCRGRMVIPRALLLLVLVYIAVIKIADPTRWTIFYGITLGFHEMGHLLTSFLPHLICAAAGSAFQIAIPIIVIIIFLRQPDYFGMTVGGFWLSYSALELAAYVGDARSKDLPLVGFAAQEDLEHDWGYILETLHMLPLDHFFAFLLRVFAIAVAAASCALAVWLLAAMWKSRGNPRYS